MKYLLSLIEEPNGIDLAFSGKPTSCMKLVGSGFSRKVSDFEETDRLSIRDSVIGSRTQKIMKRKSFASTRKWFERVVTVLQL